MPVKPGGIVRPFNGDRDAVPGQRRARLRGCQLEQFPGMVRSSANLHHVGVREALLSNAPAPVAALEAWRAARILEWAQESSDLGRDIQCDWTAEPE